MRLKTKINNINKDNMRLVKGQVMPSFSIKDVDNNVIESDRWKGKKTYLTMLRNTACPLCSFHVFRLLKMADQLRSDHVQIVAFYESKKQVILSSPFFKDQVLKEKKLQVVSDTDRHVYKLVGAEIDSTKASLEILTKHGRMPIIEAAIKAGFNGNGIEEGTNADAIPADFLINEQGIIVHAHYGADSGDNISLELVEKFSKNELK